jgi:hypothetical protein
MNIILKALLKIKPHCGLKILGECVVVSYWSAILIEQSREETSNPSKRAR